MTRALSGQLPRLLMRLAVAPLFLCLFSWILWLPKYGPDILLDSSYGAALTYFRSHGLEFGKDAVYSFGPLGYLITGVFTGHAESTQVIGALALTGMLALLFTACIIKLPRIQGVLLVFAVLLATHSDATYLAAAPLACALIAAEPRSRNATVAAVAALLALLALVKYSFFLAAVCGVAAMSIVLWQRANRRQAALAIASFCVTHGVLWLVFGGSMGAFVPYLRGSLEVAAGYTQTMYIPPEPRLLRLGLGALALALVAATGFFRGRDRMVSVNLLVWVAVLLLAWKHSFLRADRSHLLTFLLFVPYFAAGVIETGAMGFFRIVQRSAAIAAILIALTATALSNPAVLQRLWPNELLTQMSADLRRAASLDALIRDLRDRAATQARTFDLGTLKATIGSEDVDVFGQGQSLAILNDLRYRPRPAFQSFESYTPYLIRRNYEHYTASPPPFVLFGYTTVDGRYAAQEDSLTLASILANYEPMAEKFNHLLMRRVRNVAVAEQMRFIGESVAAPGEKLTVPDANGAAVWCVIESRTTVTGALRAALFQPYDSTIEFEKGDRSHEFRFLRGPAEVGFIADPLLNDLDAVRAYLCGVKVPRTRTLAIRSGGEMERVRARFYALPGPVSERPPGACGQLVFPMLGVLPRTIEGAHARVETDGKERFLAHAPAAITVDVPSEAGFVQGEYGFMRGAYERDGVTDGVIFRVLADGTGDGRPLWESWLRPLTNEADRGMHVFRLELPRGTKRLRLQTDVGPSGNGSWDWSVWSGVRFEPAAKER